MMPLANHALPRHSHDGFGIGVMAAGAHGRTTTSACAHPLIPAMTAPPAAAMKRDATCMDGV